MPLTILLLASCSDGNGPTTPAANPPPTDPPPSVPSERTEWLRPSWLAGPRTFRFIGCCYDPGRPTAFAYRAELPVQYDAVIYVDWTSATRVLPFRYPSDF